jgi:hypothetical protein
MLPFALSSSYLLAISLAIFISNALSAILPLPADSFKNCMKFGNGSGDGLLLALPSAVKLRCRVGGLNVSSEYDVDLSVKYIDARGVASTSIFPGGLRRRDTRMVPSRFDFAPPCVVWKGSSS